MVRSCSYCEKIFKKDSPGQIHCSMMCRLFSSFKKTENGCWEWQRGKDWDGYGLMSVKNKSQRATRVSYETFIGWIPPKMIVCHYCDNPPCINPTHLFLGFPQDNTNDMFQKKRERVIGEKNVKSIFTENEIREIHDLFEQGYTKTEICRIYDTSDSHIHAIITRKIWKHVDLKS